MEVKDFEGMDLEKAILTMEREMKAMWDSGEVTHILKNDKEFIYTIMTALHFERKRFQKEIGVIIGEA